VSGTIYLIAEDTNDVDVVKAILQANEISVNVEKLFLTKHGGISRLDTQLTRLIQTARVKCGDRDCIAVLHDADESTETRRKHHNRIRDICRDHHVPHIVAREEIESWLLADEGICQWLGIKAQNHDNMRKPKNRLNSLVKRKVKKDYSGATRKKVLNHVNGITRSPSLTEALKHLDGAPCIGR